MTPDEIKQYLQTRYDANKKKCKSLHLQMEMIMAEIAYYNGRFEVDKKQGLELKLVGVKGELHSLWHKQVDLYFEINK